jgi:hypothetical protein
MKLLALITLLLSSTVFACPNISGLYTCQLKSELSLKEITQTETGYIIDSNGVQMEYFTDNKGYEIPSTNSDKRCHRHQLLQGRAIHSGL